MVVRGAVLTDLEEIRRLAKQVHDIHVLNRPDVFNDVEPLGREYFASLLASENTVVLVAEEAQQILGYCIAMYREPSNNPIMRYRRIAVIDSFCVDSGHRKAGVGKAIYNAFKELAAQRGCDTLELSVWSFNREAMGFYEAIGMTPRSVTMEQRLKGYQHADQQGL